MKGILLLSSYAEKCYSCILGDILKKDYQNMNKQNSALQQIIAEIEHLPENQSYTERGIPPIFQFHKEAKILPSLLRKDFQTP